MAKVGPNLWIVLAAVLAGGLGLLAGYVFETRPAWLLNSETGQAVLQTAVNAGTSVPDDLQVVGRGDPLPDIRLGNLLLMEAAWKMDEGTLTRHEASMCNLFGSELVGRVTDHAVQIFGGLGVMEDLPIQHFWRDSRVERIWEGTSEVHRELIARDILKPYRS